MQPWRPPGWYRKFVLVAIRFRGCCLTGIYRHVDLYRQPKNGFLFLREKTGSDACLRKCLVERIGDRRGDFIRLK